MHGSLPLARCQQNRCPRHGAQMARPITGGPLLQGAVLFSICLPGGNGIWPPVANKQDSILCDAGTARPILVVTVPAGLHGREDSSIPIQHPEAAVQLVHADNSIVPGVQHLTGAASHRLRQNHRIPHRQMILQREPIQAVIPQIRQKERPSHRLRPVCICAPGLKFPQYPGQVTSYGKEQAVSKTAAVDYISKGVQMAQCLSPGNFQAGDFPEPSVFQRIGGDVGSVLAL